MKTSILNEKLRTGLSGALGVPQERITEESIEMMGQSVLFLVGDLDMPPPDMRAALLSFLNSLNGQLPHYLEDQVTAQKLDIVAEIGFGKVCFRYRLGETFTATTIHPAKTLER